MIDSPLRPLVTFALFAYNQERFIREAVAAALAQNYSPLEIILSDDCSTDDTYAIMSAMADAYDGPHRVHAIRNSENLGVARHVDAVVRRASGRFIVVAAGDDVSLPERTSALVDCWAGSDPCLVYSDQEAMDENSKAVESHSEKPYSGRHSLEAMATGAVRVLGASCGYTTNLVTRLPAMSPLVSHEDRVLPYRALLLGGEVRFVDRKLIRYRIVGGISRDKATDGRDYLLRRSPQVALRLLPDACQRLLDTMAVLPDNRTLRKRCEASIADHEAAIDFAAGSRWSCERLLLRWLFGGARAFPLFKHYLKFRFMFLFDIYFRRL